MKQAFWSQIIDADFAVPDGYDLNALTDELVSYLGETDPERRDNTAFLILANWIEKGLYTAEQLRALIATLMPNMRVGIGEVQTDSVLLRSFSTLVLSVVIYHDNTQPFLDEAEVRSLLDAAINYLLQEKDLRGYVTGIGWIHSCAHTADLLRFLARSRYLNTLDLERILNAITDKLTTPVEHIYTHGEDDRLAHTAVAVFRRELLALEFLHGWINNLVLRARQHEGPGFDPRVYGSRQNTRHFLRSVYIYLVQDPVMAVEVCKPTLLEALRSLS